MVGQNTFCLFFSLFLLTAAVDVFQCDTVHSGGFEQPEHIGKTFLVPDVHTYPYINATPRCTAVVV